MHESTKVKNTDIMTFFPNMQVVDTLPHSVANLTEVLVIITKTHKVK